MKTTLFSIFAMATVLTQAQTAGLTAVKTNAPYNEIKEVQGQLYGYYTYFTQPGIYQIDVNAGTETLVGTVPAAVRYDGNMFQTNNFGVINGKVWSLSTRNVNRTLWRIDATNIDSIGYFPVSDPMQDAEQIKNKAVVFLSRGIWSTDLTTAPVRIDDAVADMATHNVDAYDTIAYYTKFTTTKEFLYRTDGTTVQVLDSCVQVQNNIIMLGYRGGEYYYAINPGQYTSVTIKKIDANGNITTVATVGTGLYDNGSTKNAVLNNDYILFRFYKQSPNAQNLYAYNFASGQIEQLTQFTPSQSPSIGMPKSGTNGTRTYVYVDGFSVGSNKGTWVSDGTVAGTKFYDVAELKFYDKASYYDLAHTAIICGDYPVGSVPTGSFPNQVYEYSFGNATGMHPVDISQVGQSKPQWFLKYNDAIYFTAYNNFVDMDTQKTILYRVDDCELTVGVADVENSATVSVYPNPANDVVAVEMSDFSGDSKLYLRDMSGRNTEAPCFKTTKGYTVNTAEISTGMYFISIEDKHNVYTRRLVISR